MSDELITPEEIKMLRETAKTITFEIAMEYMAMGKIFPVTPITLKSGYMVSMTFNKLDGRTAEHISVYGLHGTDPADAEIIAKTVCGSWDKTMRGMLNRNVIHFIKLVKEG
jgi:hypothetical protein